MFKSSKVVKQLLYTNIILFVLSSLAPWVVKYLAMYDMNSELFMPYQLITYQFMHGNVLHILFNMIVLLSFGPMVEDIYGSKKFLIFYLLCGVSSALLHTLMTNSGNIPLVGASGSIWGIMVIYALFYPNEKLYLYFLLPIKAKYIISVLFIFEVYSALMVKDSTSHYGHIGGGLMGLAIFLFNKFKLKNSKY